MTEHELFWAGKFGDAYAERCTNHPGRVALLAKILGRTHGVESVTELGCNTGANLTALARLKPSLSLYGVEINLHAVTQLLDGRPWPGRQPHIECGSLFDTQLSADMAMTFGVLIHIPPEDLPRAYAKIHELAYRYVLMAEYYSPRHEEIPYRGHDGRLWKGDFAGEYMDRYGARLVDYGFVYHRDEFPEDDLTWFLMEV